MHSWALHGNGPILAYFSMEFHYSFTIYFFNKPKIYKKAAWKGEVPWHNATLHLHLKAANSGAALFLFDLYSKKCNKENCTC